MPANRLEIDLAVSNAEAGLRKLRAARTEMRGLEDAANDAERNVDQLGDEFDQTGRKADRYGRSVGQSSRQTDGLSRAAAAGVSRLAAMGAAAAATGASLAAIGSVRVSAQFESEFAKVNTLLDETSFRAGAANDNIAGLKLGLRELRADSGDSFANLSKGLFDLVSAGVAAEDSIRVLNDANVLAKAGVTDVSVAVDGLTTAINAYGEEADRSEVLASKFFTAQKFGKTTVEELARGLGQVAPLAAQLGVTFDELLASQAAATSAGIRQSEAYTGLKAALTNIVKPSQDAADEADRLGVAFDTAALKSKGLTDFLADIQASASFTDESFQKLFGSAEALNFVLAVTGGGAEVYAKTLRNLGDETQSVITLNEAYEKAVKVADQANKEFAGSLDQLFIIAGDAGVLEAYTAIVRGLTEALRSDAAKQFAESFGTAVSTAVENASRALQDLLDTMGGVAVVIRELNRLSEERFGAASRGAFTETPESLQKFSRRLSPFTGGLLGPEINRFIVDPLQAAGREDRALRSTTPVEIAVKADIGSVIAAIGNADDAAAEFERRLASIGEGTAIGGALRAFDNLNKSLVAANDNATKTAESIESIKPPEVGAVQRALLDQLEIAERLAEAAKGGVIRYEIELNAVELDQLAEQAVAKAKEAGEDLSLATARMIVGQIDNLDKAAAAMLDAEKALRERASDRADDLASFLDEKIAGFSREVQRADLTSRPAIVALEQSFQRLVDEIDESSIGLNTEQLEDLYANLEAAGVDFNRDVRDTFDYGAERVRQSLESALGNALDDLIFNGGKNLDEQFSRLLRDAANDNFIDPISKAFAGDGDIFGNIKGAFDKQLSGFQKALGNAAGGVASAAFSGFQGFEIGKGLSDLLGITGNKASQAAGGAIGGGLGAGAGFLIGGPLGASIGAAIGAALGNILGGLLSKPSDRTAQGVFRADTGQIAGVAQDGSGANANAAVRDELIDQITNVTKSVTDLIGGQVRNIVGTAANEAFLNVAVRTDRKSGESFIDVGFQGPGGEPVGGGRFAATEQGAIDAVTEAVRLTVSALKGGEDALVRYANAVLNAGGSLDELVSGLGALSEVFASFDDSDAALRAYANAAIDAGRSANQIVDGLNALKSVMDLAKDPLSQVAQGIKQIDDAVNPVIEDLKSLGLSIAGVSEAAAAAGRALGENFIEGIQEEIDRLSNADAADFKAILKQQRQDLEDAAALLERGFINPDEFRLVQQRNALQQTSFFEGLDQDALNNLGDFLGLIRENGGEAAVVLLQFNQELDRTRERLTEGLSAMREEADRFFDAARANLNLASDIRLRLSGETSSAQLVTFRAELQGLLAQVQGPDRIAAVEAAERAPDVAQQFIQLAEQRLGASGGLGEARDFVTDILDQIGTAAQGFGNQTLDEIALAEQQVSLLDQIKGVLESPDPAFGILEGILANGEIQSATLRDLLDQYIQLSFDGPAQNFTPGQVQQAAQQIVLPSELRISNTVTTDAPSTTLAITTAASQAKDDAEQQRELLESIEKRLGEQDEAIRKLDATLRAA